MPIRVQRKRAKGWKKPPNTIYVGRPTKWGNPFRLEDYDHPPELARVSAVADYESWMNEKNIDGFVNPLRKEAQKELRGFNLSCFCKEGDICHADILLKIANE